MSAEFVEKENPIEPESPNFNRKYSKIGFQTRKELIIRVMGGQRLREVAQALNVKVSTAKFIIKLFKKEGRVTSTKDGENSKKDQRELQELHMDYLKVSEAEAEEPTPKLVPVYCLVPLVSGDQFQWGLSYQWIEQTRYQTQM